MKKNLRPARAAMIGISAIVGVILVLGAVSAGYTGLIKPVSPRSELVIKAPAEKVWEVLADLPSWSRWSPNFAEISGELVAGEKLQTRMRAGGNDLEFEPVVLRAEPGAELRWRGEFIVPGLVDGEHFFLLERTTQGHTRLIQGEDFTGALVLYAGGALDIAADMAAFNEALAAEVERRR